MIALGGGVVIAVDMSAATAATVDTNAVYVLINRNSGNNQLGQFVDSGGGYYRLKSRNSGKVLDVNGPPPPTAHRSSGGAITTGPTSSPASSATASRSTTAEPGFGAPPRRATDGRFARRVPARAPVGRTGPPGHVSWQRGRQPAMAARTTFWRRT
ncbi:hypothetical protein ACPPVO_47495 [Dactylosporangium sp. McL0621]|uniref:hypothetical protein n=1 Tax=Dactylosporangium sp. McL0621 TaxID=3415678 RepID=UPI003CF270F2